MSGGRARGFRVERATETRAAVVIARSAATAMLAFLAGVALVVWSAGGVRRPPSHAAPRVEHDASPLISADATSEDRSDLVTAEHDAAPTSPAADDPAEPSAETAPTPGFVVVEGDAGLAAVHGAGAAASADGDAGAGADVPTAVPFAGPRRVEHGRVAYLRCDGVPQRPGPYPCPRDEALEAAVWNVLETLPRCAEAPPGLGESDVRLELARDRPTVLRLRAPRPDVPRLDGAAVLRCAAGPLSHVATTSGATRLMLAFRFSLVDAATPRGREAP
jgi:hypothetical protein